MMLNAALIFFATTTVQSGAPVAVPAPSLLAAQPASPQQQQQQHQAEKQHPAASPSNTNANAFVLSVPGGRFVIVNGKWAREAGGDAPDAGANAPHVIGSSIPVPFTISEKGRTSRGGRGGRNQNISPPTVVPAD